MADDAINPWAKENWSLTGQAQYIKRYGMARAEARARDAKTKIGAKGPSVPTDRRYLDGAFIFHRDYVDE